jgi:DNA-directed RNA polymerase specialized sigma24 family protein
LHAAAGLTAREVATALGLTVPAAKARIFRARTRLQSSLRPVRFSRRNPKEKTSSDAGHVYQSV